MRIRGRKLDDSFTRPDWKSPDLSGLTPQPQSSFGFLKAVIWFTAGAAAFLLALITYSSLLKPSPTDNGGDSTRGAFTVTAAVEQAKAGVVQIIADLPPLKDRGIPVGSPNILHASGRVRGAGCILNQQGNIVTAADLVAGAKQITVILSDGKELPATLKGVDLITDLAVLKVDSAMPLSPLTPADSSQLRVGQTVVAIGHPSNLPYSVTEGIISGLHRQLAYRPDLGDQVDLIQSGITLLSGSSGGPLLDRDGKLLGVNLLVSVPPTIAIAPQGNWPKDKTAKVSEAPGILLPPDSAGFGGFAFAAPMNVVAKVADELIQHGSYMRPWLGVEGEVAKDVAGVKVTRVSEDSPAQQAGLKADDIITEADGHRVAKATEIQAIVLGHRSGDRMHFSVRRDGKTLDLAATLRRLPMPE